jgi:hypothetical protein
MEKMAMSPRTQILAILLLTGFLAPLVPATLGAQTASFTYINQKAPYSNPPGNMMTVLNLPKVGTTFKVQVPNAAVYPYPNYTAYHLLFGVNNPNVKLPVLNGWLFTSFELMVTAPWNGRNLTVTMSFPIPNSPHVLGARFYMQVLGVSTAPTGWWFQLSRGGLAVVGT